MRLYLCISLLLAVLRLHCCTGSLKLCVGAGAPLEPRCLAPQGGGLSRCRAWALSCAQAWLLHGTWDQGRDLWSLHWQADS